jgi:hypothetical protein
MGIVKTSAREGRFVFWGSAAGDRNKHLVNATGTVVAGFAERWMTRPKFDPTAQESLEVKAGETIHIQTTGEFFAVTSTAAVPGQEVFAATADGQIVTGTPVANGEAPDGTVKTGFFVAAVEPSGGGAAGSLIVISTYTIPVIPPQTIPDA